MNTDHQIKFVKRTFLMYTIVTILLVLLYTTFSKSLGLVGGILILAFGVSTPLILNGIFGLTWNITWRQPLHFVKEKASLRSWTSLVVGIILLVYMLTFLL